MNTQLLRDFDENINIEGFDVHAGQTWIYPINYPLRNYQFNIVSESLYKNTLVSLPTGLGKTFIAAVLMYNFYRWFPSGKVVFMAPTKPLVKQQLEACYNIMAIPKDVTAELTGSKAQTSRKDIWMNKRVFFITPQVLQNDLNLIPELGKQIKCIVIDEAHKAKGNHAYCEVLRQIVENNKHFRVLALSATPGSSINDVSEIINNLLISHLEIRTDDSPDVMPYVFQRTMETIVVPLGEKLQSVKAAYIQLLEKYTRILVTNRIIVGNNCANLTKGRVFMIMKEFQEKNRHTRMRGYGDIMRNLNICVTLYHGYELLTRHGLRGFLNFFQEHSDQALLRGNLLLDNIKADVQEYLGPAPSIDILPDGSPPEISPLTKFGHPKFYKLQEILLNHFSDRKNCSSKVIVFTEYRESVKEIYALLIQHTPVIKPKYFLGQSSITQKQQILAINSFRSGDTNTLVSTCIGEEGLDIGEVDLIICFDISNKSPIRMVQRMGRTGRKKEGKIIVLVTEGKEEEILKECLVNKHYLSKNILKSREIHSNLFQHNPRMVPESLTPTCQKIHISVPQSTKTTKKGNLKAMLSNMAGSSKELSTSQQFSDIEIIEMKDRIPDAFMVWNKGKMDCIDAIDSHNKEKMSFSKRLETLRVAQPTGIIGHSKSCDILTSLMQFADSKRYNLPVTQTRVSEISPVGNKKTKFGRHNSSDNYKQSDIRTMFLKPQADSSTQAVTKNDTENIMDLINKDKANDLINELHSEISSYMSLSCIAESNCKICDKLFICYRTTKRNCDINLETWIPPDTSILNDLNLNNILRFQKVSNPAEQMLDNTDLALFADIDDNDWNELHDKTHNFTFEPPKSAKKIFEMSKIEENVETDKEDSSNMDVLSFFKLDGIQNIFNDEVKRMNINTEMANQSPILSSTSQEMAESNRSPVLSTFDHKPRITINRKLFDTKESDQNGALACKSNADALEKTKPNLSNLNSAKKSNFFKSKTLEQNVKDEVEEIPTSKDHISQLFSNIQDFCDLSVFGFEMSQKHQSAKQNDTIEECHKIVDLKETSNSGSDDLFSCSNSPVKNEFDNLKDIPQRSESVIDVPEKDQILIENDYFDRSTSPILAKDILRARSQRYVDGSKSNQIRPTNRPNSTNKQEDAPQKISKQEMESLSALDVWDISIFGLQNAGSISDDNNTKKEETKKQSSNKNTSEVSDFCDLSFFGVQLPSFDPDDIDTPKTAKSTANPFMDVNNKGTQISQVPQNKEKSQISITQMLDIINEDHIQASQKENQATNVNCQKDTSPLISSNKLKTSSLKSNYSKRKLSISDDDFSEMPKNLKTSKTQITQRQSSIKKKLHAKRKRPPSPNACDSGDEFENSPFKNDSWISVRRKSVQRETPPKNIEKAKRKKKKKIPNTYIDDEAVLTSSDEAAFKDSQSEPSTSEDVFEASFVNDETFANTTAMHAKYLQSTRSPLLNKGAFKIPAQPALRREIIFSQEVNNENDAYMNDTFCVGDDIALTQNDDLTELELAERLLEEKKRKKTKKDYKNRKKTKIIVLSSDSD